MLPAGTAQPPLRLPMAGGAERRAGARPPGARGAGEKGAAPRGHAERALVTPLQCPNGIRIIEGNGGLGNRGKQEVKM